MILPSTLPKYCFTRSGRPPVLKSRPQDTKWERIRLYNAGMLKTTDMQVERIGPARKVGIGAWITRRYTRQGLWSLFLMCAFPLHAWTLILAMRDISWLTERTNAWDAVGVASYGLVFAFFESLVLWAVAVLLGYLVAERWEPARRVALLVVLTLVLALWAMLDQLYFLMGTGFPGWMIGPMVRSGHPLWIIYGSLLGLAGLSVMVPVWLVMRSERAFRWVLQLIDRLSVLTVFYLVLDAVGLVIVIVRNL